MKELLLQTVALVQLRSASALEAVLSYSSPKHAVRLVHTLSVESVRPFDEYCMEVQFVPGVHTLSEIGVSAFDSYCVDVHVDTVPQVRSEVAVLASFSNSVAESHTVSRLQLRLLTYESPMSPVPIPGAMDSYSQLLSHTLSAAHTGACDGSYGFPETRYCVVLHLCQCCVVSARRGP